MHIATAIRHQLKDAGIRKSETRKGRIAPIATEGLAVLVTPAGFILTYRSHSELVWSNTQARENFLERRESAKEAILNILRERGLANFEVSDPAEFNLTIKVILEAN